VPATGWHSWWQAKSLVQNGLPAKRRTFPRETRQNCWHGDRKQDTYKTTPCPRWHVAELMAFRSRQNVVWFPLISGMWTADGERAPMMFTSGSLLHIWNASMGRSFLYVKLKLDKCITLVWVNAKADDNLIAGFVRSWKTWKSHGILKWSFPGREKSWKKLKS